MGQNIQKTLWRPCCNFVTMLTQGKWDIDFRRKRDFVIKG